MCPIQVSETNRQTAGDAPNQSASKFFPCNCGHPGPLGRERCGVEMKAFAVRCPSCNKSVQAFTEEGLPGNWNAVSRKHTPAPTAALK